MSGEGVATAAPSKTVATWLALLGGSLGLHRFYLAGARDPWAWLHPWPTLLGAYGFWRMRTWGVDDTRGSALLAATMLQAIVYGLTSDERWAARHGARPGGAGPAWPVLVAVVIALAAGASIAVATIAFTAQRYFEARVGVT
jgi:TM2 domain-containing membrane protein YozV